MIPYQKFTLDNGLTLLVHEDPNSKIAITNLLYQVGSRQEILGKTGLAHYFEHLMFGGSKHVPAFDTALEKVGGSCNAFTNTDITNYYTSLPAVNLETAFWLESDRMLHLNLDKKTIETQRKVVTEEFKQRYLNQPYGDVHHLTRNLAYEVHPYKWPTIGLNLEDIEQMTDEDVAEFYFTHYRPDNAIMVVAGGVKSEEVLALAEKWFGDIPMSEIPKKTITQELPQREKKTLTVERDVPTDALYKIYHMPGRLSEGYIEADLITDILAFGRSSLLEQRLVKNGDVFASISAYITGTIDPGLMIFSGKMEKGQSAETAEKELDALVQEFLTNEIDEKTIQKIKNQAEAHQVYENIQLMNRAFNLAYHTNLGAPELYQEHYAAKVACPPESIKSWASEIIQEENASVLYYKSKAS